ncbi:MAG: acetyl-CoA acetyltransferase [Deltaproteobacteria bacterium RBG_16_49_23]|nr:MAG: acetyl-CoA acetyltransferase [Deltaproteobacteria bacterium RBG_16_49_23]
MGKNDVVVVSAVRTTFGKFGGVLKDVPSIDLGAMAIREVLRRVNVKGEEVEETYYGVAVPGEVGLETDVPARQATLKAGLPGDSVSLTLDRACCSSMAAVRLGYRAIKAGEIEIALGVGAENMSRTPLVVPPYVRWGSRLGSIELWDGLFGLGYKGFNPVSVDTGEVALEYGISREDQDRWAYGSQMKYAKAFSAGKFVIGEELMRVEIPQGKRPPIILEQDEFPKPDTTLEKLSKLPLVYGSPTVTAGNAPGLDTGASAILMMSEKKAREKGLKPLARIVSMIATATTPRLIAAIPGFTIQRVLEKAGMSLDQIDLIEVNEAFAAMPLVSAKILSNGDSEKMKAILEKTNVNGGAIAIGHPVGASGARILLTMIYELRRRGGGTGVASICGGLAQGEGAIVQVDGV